MQDTHWLIGNVGSAVIQHVHVTTDLNGGTTLRSQHNIGVVDLQNEVEDWGRGTDSHLGSHLSGSDSHICVGTAVKSF